MTFIHPALLTGLLLAGLPILLHLIMRQKPKQLPFPAFRFLVRKATSNRRRMRLRHLLLLLMRIGLVALMCLALARPRIFSERFNLLADRAAAVFLVIDTSPSMGYTVAGRNRLDEAKARAMELVESLPAGSQFAVIDGDDPSSFWLPSASAARERIAACELTSHAGTMSNGVAAAYRMFADLANQSKPGDEVPPRYLYVFSDRTPASWDVSRSGDLINSRDRLGEPKIEQTYIDVGLEKPVDVAMSELRLARSILPSNRPVLIPVAILATGQDVETQIQCRIDGSPETENKPVKLTAGQSREIIFERRGLKPGLHRAEIRLATDDALMANNVLYATVDVVSPRSVLVLCDRVADGQLLAGIIKANYTPDIKSTDDPAIRAMTPSDFAKYAAVCLLNVAAPARAGLWERLERFVTDGGGVAIFLGGEELIVDDYNDKPLMPGTLKEVVADEAGAVLSEYQYQHPMMAQFRGYAQNFGDSPPKAFRYWAVEPRDGANHLVRYADAKRRPAVLESSFERKIVRGRVLLFTTPFDYREDNSGRPWNDFVTDWVGMALANHALQYLGREAEAAELNFISGGQVVVRFPTDVRPAAFTLVGPGVTGADALVPRPEKGNELRLPQAKQPGHYTVSTPDRSWSTGFSVNISAEEFQLVPRVPVEAITTVLGSDSVIAPGQAMSMKDKLDQRNRQPLELFPWIMLFLLLVFAVENYFANRFYRNEQPPTPEPPARDIISP